MTKCHKATKIYKDAKMATEKLTVIFQNINSELYLLKLAEIVVYLSH